MRKPLWYARAWRFRWGTIAEWMREKYPEESRYEKMQRVSLVQLAHPEPGDYWSEMLSPVLVVVAVTHGIVIFCEKTKATDKDHWTWDLTQLTSLPLAEFQKKLCYGSAPDLKGKPWADCQPRGHLWVLDALKELEKP